MKKSFQRLIEKAEEKKGKIQYKSFPLEVKSVDEAKYQIRAVFSTGAIDRHGEIVDQKGWDLTEFKKNPVVLFCHDHTKPAVGKVLVEDSFGPNAEGNLEGTIQFAAAEYELAMTLWKLYKGKYMSAFSAGFINDEYVVDQVNEVLTLTKNRLLEESCVNVPANAEALAKSGAPAPDITEEVILEIAAEVMNECGDNPESILAVIRALTGALKAVQEADEPKAKAEGEDGAKVEHPLKVRGGKKRIPVNLLNRAVKELLGVKKNN
jgi:hypothetical protein